MKSGTRLGGVILFLAGGVLACGGGTATPPAAQPAPSQQTSAPPSSPQSPVAQSSSPGAISGADGTRVTVQGDAIGGSPLLQETMGAIAVHNTLQESAASSEQAARAAQHVAREQIDQIGDERAAEMERVLDSMNP